MRLTQAAPTPAHSTIEQVLCNCLDDEELETLLCVYLQNRLGYMVQPPTRMRVESDHYVLRNRVHDVALVSVRCGRTPVPRDARSLGAQRADHVYVFSPTDTYGPDPAPNVTEVRRDEMIEFIRSEGWSLPLSVSQALDEAA